MKRTRILATIAVLTLLLVVLVGCTPQKVPATTTPTSSVTTPAATTTPQQLTELQGKVTSLQTQVDGILKNPNLTTDYSAQLKSIQTQLTTINSSLTEARSNAATAITNSTNTATSLATLKSSVDSLKATVTAIQQAQAVSVTLGTTPVNINGLSVTYLTQTVYVGSVANDTPATVQFAIKITNATDKAFNNVDIVGFIRIPNLSYYNSQPTTLTLVDAEGKIFYNSYYNGSTDINFEAYNTQVVSGRTVINTNLSIPKQSSITLRPRLTIQATNTYQLSNQQYTVGLNTITYDVAQ